MKVCPMMIGKKANTLCMGENCAWWCKFAGDCSVPLIAGILADSSICQNEWQNTDILEDEETPFRSCSTCDNDGWSMPQCQKCDINNAYMYWRAKEG